MYKENIHDDGLEARFQELVKKHQSSKAKVRSKIKYTRQNQQQYRLQLETRQVEAMELRDYIAEYKSENSTLKGIVETTQAELTEIKSEMASMRSRLLDKQQDNDKLRRDLVEARSSLESSKSSTSARHQDGSAEVARSTAERYSLEREMKLLRMENERMAKREDRVELLETEHDHLQAVADLAVEECARFYLTRVSKSYHEAVKRELEQATVEIRETRAKEDMLEDQLALAQEEAALLREKLEVEIGARKAAEDIVNNLLEQRRLDRVETNERVADAEETRVAGMDLGAEVDRIELQHSVLVGLAAQIQLEDSLADQVYLQSRSDNLKATLKATKDELKQTRSSLSNVENRQRALETAHAGCGPAVNGLRAEIARWQEEEQRLSSNLSVAQDNIQVLEEKNKRDRESLKRANDTVMRSKAAEEALEDEIQM